MKTTTLILLLVLPTTAAAQAAVSTSAYISAEAAARSLLGDYLAVNNAYLNTSPEARDFCGSFGQYGKTRRQEYFLEAFYRTPFILSRSKQLEATLKLLDVSLESYTLTESRALAPVLEAIGNMSLYGDLNARSYRACLESRLIREAGISTSAVTALTHKQYAITHAIAQAQSLAIKNAIKVHLARTRAAQQEAAAKSAEVLGGLTPKEAIAAILAARKPARLFTEQPPNPESIEKIKRLLAARRLKNK